MKPNIADFLKRIYQQNIKDHQDIHETTNKKEVKGLDSDFFIFDNQQLDLDLDIKQNVQEAEMIVQMVQYLIQAGNKVSQITVLSQYQQQVELIKEKFRNENQTQVRVESVDDYLGQENDIVIISLVILNNHKKLFKRKYQNRIKTAFSRAKLGLYVFGYFDYYSRQSTLYDSFFSKFITQLYDEDYLTHFIPLKCHIHGTVKQIQQSSYFLNINGGCFCNNHTCKKQYLPGTQNQNDCQEMCEKILKCRHKCQQRCQAQCICTFTYYEILPECNHTVLIQCGQDLADVICQEDVEIYFHSSCKHTNKFKCYEINSAYQECQHNCDKVLPCGHTCKKKCRERCYPCEQKCIKSMTCGHRDQCKNLCYQKCSPCAYNITIQLHCGMHSIQKKCFEIKNHIINDLKMPPTFLNSRIGMELVFRISENLAKGLIKDVKNFQQIQDFQCKYPCSRPRKCGHQFQCNNYCYQECTPCEYEILLTLKCGHQYQYQCEDVKVALKELLPIEEYENLCQSEHEKILQLFENCIQCSKPCDKIRACEHYFPCSNSCSQPCIPCQVEITITLPCGHLRLVKCHTVQTSSTGIVKYDDEQACENCSIIY